MSQSRIDVLDFLLDDHFAFWDFADSFPSHRPEAPDSAVGELVELVQQNYVAVTFGRWAENASEPVPRDLAVTVLKNPVAWKPTGQDAGYLLELTTTGREYLRRGGIGLVDS